MFAVIDLGSNSFHLLIADHNGERFTVVDRFSEKIQLADGLSRKGKLTKSAIKRGIECLRNFREIIAKHPIKRIQVVGTQALRQASNAEVFLERARALGFAIDVISGPREAELIFRGICNPLPDSDARRLVIDIGGGSTEIALGSNGKIEFATSIPVGCVNWRDRFFAKRIEYDKRGLVAKEAAYSELKQVRNKLLRNRWQETYASSGSAKMLSNISRTNGWSNGEITSASISKIESAIGKIKQSSDINLQGLSAQRQDLLAPGVAIMATIMESLNIDTIIYSRSALREGVLSELSNLRVDYHFK